ncbi:MAG: DedA family protein [Acidimicrobiales bacterium]
MPVLLRPSSLAAVSAVAVAASTIGTALLAGLLPTRPELLLALSPGNVILLLVARRIPFSTYYAIGVTRLVLSDIAPYLLGYLHGRRGVELVVRRDRHRQRIDEHTERLRPSALVALFVSASVVVSAIAGLVRVRPMVFVVLDVMGATTRLLLFWWLADLFAAQLDAVIELIEDWQWALLAVGLVGAATFTWLGRRGKPGPATAP